MGLLHFVVILLNLKSTFETRKKLFLGFLSNIITKMFVWLQLYSNPERLSKMFVINNYLT